MLTGPVILNALTGYLYTGALLFLLTPAVIFVTLIFKSYVPSFAFVIIATFAELVTIFAGSKYATICPWTAPLHLMSDSMVHINSEFTSTHSASSIMAVFVIGLVSSLAYFRRADIH